tara:strand:- start:365 stop:808 length:444 start_codon:yes stop_codon:yes gene_type:complete
MKIKMLLLLSLLTCGDDSPSTDSALVSFECAHPPPNGLYFVSFDTLESECGPLSSSATQVSDGVVELHESAGCELVSKASSPRTCETDAVFECDDGTWEMRLDWSIKPDPLNEDQFVGVLFVDMLRFTGWTCTGTYGLTGERINEDR